VLPVHPPCHQALVWCLAQASALRLSWWRQCQSHRQTQRHHPCRESSRPPAATVAEQRGMRDSVHEFNAVSDIEVTSICVLGAGYSTVWEADNMTANLAHRTLGKPL
jgi:hypothetical protein